MGVLPKTPSQLQASMEAETECNSRNYIRLATHRPTRAPVGRRPLVPTMPRPEGRRALTGPDRASVVSGMRLSLRCRGRSIPIIAARLPRNMIGPTAPIRRRGGSSERQRLRRGRGFQAEHLQPVLLHDGCGGGLVNPPSHECCDGGEPSKIQMRWRNRGPGAPARHGHTGEVGTVPIVIRAGDRAGRPAERHGAPVALRERTVVG